MKQAVEFHSIHYELGNPVSYKFSSVSFHAFKEEAYLSIKMATRKLIFYTKVVPVTHIFYKGTEMKQRYSYSPWRG